MPGSLQKQTIFNVSFNCYQSFLVQISWWFLTRQNSVYDEQNMDNKRSWTTIFPGYQSFDYLGKVEPQPFVTSLACSCTRKTFLLLRTISRVFFYYFRKTLLKISITSSITSQTKPIESEMTKDRSVTSCYENHTQTLLK